MKKQLSIALAAIAMASSVAFAGGKTLLLLPPRHNLINLGFDLQEMKSGSIDIACYSTESALSGIEYYLPAAGRWEKPPVENWAKGAYPFYGHDTVIIVGDSAAAKELLNGSKWAKQVLTSDGRRIHEIATLVDSVDPLSKSQWSTLSQRQGIVLLEMQEKGRYELADEQRAVREAERAAKRAEKEQARATREELRAKARAEKAAREEAEARAREEARVRAREEKAAREEAEARARAEKAAREAAEDRAREELRAKARAEKAAREEAEARAREEARARVLS